MKKPIALIRILLASALLGLGLHAHAITFWWDGYADVTLGQSDNVNTSAQAWLNEGLWDDGTNSIALPAWTPGDSAIFGGSATNQAITAGTLTIGNMTFGEGAQGAGTSGTAYTITGGSITLSNTVVTVNTPTTIASPLAGASATLTKQGTATLTLSGAETYTGATTVSQGTLIFSTTGNDRFRSAGAGAISVASGATFQIDTGSSSPRLDNVAFTVIGSGTLSKAGSGTVFFANGAAVGQFNMSAGGLVNVTAGAISDYGTTAGNLADLTIASGASVAQGKAATYFNALNGAGTFANANNFALTFGVNNGSGTFSGVISGGGTFTKAGTGTQVLSGLNTYTGATTVSNGTLWVNGSQSSSSAVTVTPNGVLGGTGTINGSVTLQGGATLGAGTSTSGTLSLASTLTLNGGSTNVMRINKSGATLTADKINMIGASGIAYNGVLTVVSNAGSDAFVLGDKFTLFAKSAGTFSGSFVSSNLPALTAGLVWDTTALVFDGSIQVHAPSLTLPPSFSLPAGGYIGAQSVALTNGTPGSTIYYTTDGSVPTTSSAVYSTPIAVPMPTNMTITAFAKASGLGDSLLVTSTYGTVATPTWVNTAGGSWPTTANWAYSVVPSGSGSTADFSTLTLPANVSVAVDGARTVGSMVFDDQNATKHSWTLNPGSGGALTLAVGSGAPVISNNVPTMIGAILAGTQGFTKSGTGVLTLANTNTYTGTTTVNSGTTLQLGDGAAYNGVVTGNITDNGTLTFANPNAQTYSGVVSGTGSLTKTGGGMLTLNGTSTFTGGSTVNGGAITLANGGANGIIRGSLTINSAGTVNPTTTWSLGQGTGGATNIVINGGTLNFTGTADNGGTAAQAITMTGGTISGSHFDWYNGITSTPLLTTAPSSSTATISSGFRLRLANNKVTLNVAKGSPTNGVDLLISAPITSNASDGVNKTGAGLLSLTATSTYPGATTVTGGALHIESPGRLTVSAVTVQTNGTLIGTGEIDGTTTIQTGGTLAPGGLTNLGTAYLLGKLTINAGATNRFRISKDGGFPSSDSVVLGTLGVQYGGTLIITDVTSDATPMAHGDTFTLFQFGPWSGGFTTVVWPNLPAGLYWDLGGLGTSGSIQVTSNGVPASTPTFSPPAGGYVGAQSVTINCATPGAVIRYTTDGSTPTNTSPVYSGPIALSDSTNVTIQAYATAANYSDSAVASATYATEPVAIWTTSYSESWGNAGNWTNSIIPDASGITADFSTLPLASDMAVTLDGARTIGQMIFGDLLATYNWELTPGSGALTLAGTTPTITVNNGTTTVGVVLAGSSGLVKNGNGALAFKTSPTYTGPTIVSAGTLNVSNGVAISSTSSLSVSNGAVVNLIGTGATQISANATNWIIAGTVSLQTASGSVGASVQYPAGTFTLNGGTLTGDAVDNVAGNLLLNGSPGQIFPVTANGTGNTISCYSIAGYNASGNANYIVALNTPQAGDTLAVSSVIHDGVPGNVPLSVTKSGLGIVTLSGASTCSGVTTVSNGTLLVNGALGTNIVTVHSGATLGGSGTLGGPVTVNSGGSLSPGTSPGLLTINNTLTLNSGSVTRMEINRDLVANDSIAGLDTVTFGGTLSVTNLSGTFANGDTYTLFAATNYAGNFTATNLPALASGLKWNWNPANGTLSVNTSLASNPTNITYSVSAGQLTLNWPADHTGWKLQAQTNSLSTGLSGTWHDLGYTGTNHVTFPVDATKPTVFYRLALP